MKAMQKGRLVKSLHLHTDS